MGRAIRADEDHAESQAVFYTFVCLVADTHVSIRSSFAAMGDDTVIQSRNFARCHACNLAPP